MNKLVALVLALTALPLLEGCGDSPPPKRDARPSDASTAVDSGPPRDTAASDLPAPVDAPADRAVDGPGGDVTTTGDTRDGGPPDAARDVTPPTDTTTGDVARDMAVDQAPVDTAPADSAPPDTSVDTAPADTALGDVVVADGPALDPDAGAGEQVFVASLSGSSETPPVTTSATGSFTMVLNAAKTEIRYNLKHNVAGATMAHLHIGSAGEAGPVAIPLAPLSNDASGTAPITVAQVAELEAGRLYANIHSPTHSDGEIRGQVLRPGEIVFVATLSGDQENPPVTTSASGAGSFIVSAAKDSLRYRVTITNISANAAHVHKGAGGVNGAIVFNLEPLGVIITGTTSMDAARLADLERGLWYANVHSPTAPDGEIRGQILHEGETLYTARMSGANEVPPVATAATGGLGLIVNAARTAARYDGAVTGMTPTVAHIHVGAAGTNGDIAYPLVLTGTTLSGELVLSASDLAALNAGVWYANVHSLAHMDGEIRGQLGRR